MQERKDGKWANGKKARRSERRERDGEPETEGEAESDRGNIETET
jgi:hypothetical protein